MRVTESKQVTQATLRMLKEKSMGERPQDEPLHASDIYGCDRKTVASRLFGTPPKSREDIEIMFPGFALQEYCWGEEEDGEMWEGGIFSVDGFTKDGAVLEYKTTGSPVYYLDQPKEEWVDRSRSYCVVQSELRGIKVREVFICVYSFTSRKFKEWHIEFSDKEVQQEKKWLLTKIPELYTYIKRGELPPVTSRRYEYECMYCPFYKHEDVDCKPLLKENNMTKTVRKKK